MSIEFTIFCILSGGGGEGGDSNESDPIDATAKVSVDTSPRHYRRVDRQEQLISERENYNRFDK